MMSPKILLITAALLVASFSSGFYLNCWKIRKLSDNDNSPPPVGIDIGRINEFGMPWKIIDPKDDQWPKCPPGWHYVRKDNCIGRTIVMYTATINNHPEPIIDMKNEFIDITGKAMGIEDDDGLSIFVPNTTEK